MFQEYNTEFLCITVGAKFLRRLVETVSYFGVWLALYFTGNLEKTIELNKRDLKKKDKTIADLRAKIAALEKTIEEQNKEISELEGK